MSANCGPIAHDSCILKFLFYEGGIAALYGPEKIWLG